MKKFGIIFVVLSVVTFCIYYLSSLNEKIKEGNKINFIIKKETNAGFSKNDEYLVAVLACEMPASYNEEALKAQAVAARTFALYRTKVENASYLTDSDQCTNSIENMKEKWGSKFDFYYEKLKKVVLDTKDFVILKDNKLLKTFYFSTSNGYTESSLNVFNEVSTLSVNSEWDKNSKDYLKTIELSKSEMTKKLGSFKNISILKRNDTNHVVSIKVDSKEYSGVEFRKLLSLRSTDFDIEYKDDKYIITTRGYGHGVGLSQYGANYMASSGKNYKEILKYYYGDVDIQKFNV